MSASPFNTSSSININNSNSNSIIENDELNNSGYPSSSTHHYTISTSPGTSSFFPITYTTNNNNSNNNSNTYNNSNSNNSNNTINSGYSLNNIGIFNNNNSSNVNSSNSSNNGSPNTITNNPNNNNASTIGMNSGGYFSSRANNNLDFKSYVGQRIATIQNNANNANNANSPSSSPKNNININNNNNNNNETNNESNTNINNNENHHQGSLLYQAFIFREGFGPFLKSSYFSDITIIANERKYYLHKVILAHSSQFFADHFDQQEQQNEHSTSSGNNNSNINNNEENILTKSINNNNSNINTSNGNSSFFNYIGSNTYELKGQFIEFFELVVLYMYEGKVNLTPKNALPILWLSNTYSIRGLKKVATFYLTSSITKENALSMLNNAINIDSDDLVSKCITVICKHFNQIILPNSFYKLYNTNSNIINGNSNGSSFSQLILPNFGHFRNNSESDGNNNNSNGGSDIDLNDHSTTTTIIQSNDDDQNNGNDEINAIPSVIPLITTTTTSTTTTTTTILDKQLNYQILKDSEKSLDPSTINTIAELLSLPLHIMIRLMKQNNLSVSNESIVYKTVLKYIQFNKSNLTEKDIGSLFEVVRFPLFSYQQLEELGDTSMVPSYLITEALLYRLKIHEGPKDKESRELKEKEQKESSSSLNVSNIINTPSSSSNIGSSLSISNIFNQQQQNLIDNQCEMDGSIGSLLQIRKTPRTAYATSLEYSSDFDTFGVFYYIGTNGGKEEWSNPALRGRVRVACSSQEKGSVIDCFNRTSSEFWSMDVPASWISVNLGSSRTMVPTCYTLRHGGNSKADCLRNWTLQGSVDGKNWTVLVRHSNDASLNGNFSTCSWPIPNCTQAYRHFRILQTGRNSSNHNFLSISGIEFYGDLYETRPVS